MINQSQLFFNSLVLSIMKKLDRLQMKNLKGGIESGTKCQCQNPGGEGPIISDEYDPSWASQCAATVGGHWCCASCCTASWSDHYYC
ncbi:MAG: hypothetical protein ABIP79_13195 [Chitinophagaceae bacterium]